MFSKEYSRLLVFLRPHLGLFMLAVSCMIASAVFDGVSLGMLVPLLDNVMTGKSIVLPSQAPQFVSGFIDKLNTFDPHTLLNIMIFPAMLLLLLKAGFSFLQGYLMTDVGQRVIKDLRNKIYAKLQTFSLDYYSRKRSGELISRITNDVSMVENALSYGIYDLIYQSLQVVVYIGIAFFIYWRMAILSFLVMPLIVFPIVNVGKKLRKISTRSQEKVADINSLLFETISGVRVVKAFCMERYEVDKFNNQNRDYYKLTMKAAKRMLVLGPATELIGSLGGLAVFYWAGKEVIAGQLSFGVFALFLGALLSTIRPFKKLSQVNSLLQRALAANTRIYNVLDVAPSVQDKEGALPLTAIKDGVEFSGVSFSYGDKDVLMDVSLRVDRGEVLAIVGPSGAGKSTFLDLLLRFYEPQKGRILVDGRDIRDFTLRSLRKKIGIVTQETILFNDTVGANIAYGNTGVGLREIEAAAKDAFAHDFIMQMPQGYDTVIGDRGFRLSGGERQRIAIARAILKDAPILLLDEATSQLDSRSEQIVQQALETLMRGRTVFVVAHRLSTVRRASQIVVLENGRIVDAGRHNELMERAGLYCRLHNLQEGR
ncbi:MAG: ABC transporter ATP-binding protein [Candidatus Omnitrophota bacterium]